MSAFGTGLKDIFAPLQQQLGNPLDALKNIAKNIQLLTSVYVQAPLYQIYAISLASSGLTKVLEAPSPATLVYFSVYSGTMDVYFGDGASTSTTPHTRVTVTGFPVPMAVPPNTYRITVLSRGGAVSACVILTSA
jgi:hypothetical protein